MNSERHKVVLSTNGVGTEHIGATITSMVEALRDSDEWVGDLPEVEQAWVEDS